MYAGTDDGVNWGFSEHDDWLENCPLTDSEYKELIDGQKAGKEIVFSHGKKPFLCDSLGPEERNELNKCIQYLYATDYAIVKIAEGAARIEEYERVIEAREEARKRIASIYAGGKKWH